MARARDRPLIARRWPSARRAASWPRKALEGARRHAGALPALIERVLRRRGRGAVVRGGGRPERRPGELHRAPGRGRGGQGDSSARAGPALHTIPALMAVAWAARPAHQERVLAVVNALRGEVYAAEYRFSDGPGGGPAASRGLVARAAALRVPRARRRGRHASGYHWPRGSRSGRAGTGRGISRAWRRPGHCSSSRGARARRRRSPTCRRGSRSTAGRRRRRPSGSGTMDAPYPIRPASFADAAALARHRAPLLFGSLAPRRVPGSLLHAGHRARS